MGQKVRLKIHKKRKRFNPLAFRPKLELNQSRIAWPLPGCSSLAGVGRFRWAISKDSLAARFLHLTELILVRNQAFTAWNFPWFSGSVGVVRFLRAFSADFLAILFWWFSVLTVVNIHVLPSETFNKVPFCIIRKNVKTNSLFTKKVTN